MTDIIQEAYALKNSLIKSRDEIPTLIQKLINEIRILKLNSSILSRSESHSSRELNIDLLKSKATLGSTAVVSDLKHQTNSLRVGSIVEITQRGIRVEFEIGNDFFKWCNVKEIIK